MGNEGQIKMLSKIEIIEYAHLYKKRSPKDILLEDQFFKWFKMHRYLNKEMFVRLGCWKTKRQIRNYLRNKSEFVKTITKKALETKDERSRIETLMKLHGVSWAVASVILHFAFPNYYPILDFRAIWSLCFGQPNTYTFDFWERYVERFRLLQKRTRLDARTLDRGLWMYSKLHQKLGEQSTCAR